jgi:hypothetical protein
MEIDQIVIFEFPALVLLKQGFSLAQGVPNYLKWLTCRNVCVVTCDAEESIVLDMRPKQDIVAFNDGDSRN